MTEGEAFDKLCSDLGIVCDLWQEGKIDAKLFIAHATLAAQRWLDDQVANSPK